jgi:hypothetical protein
MTPVIARGIRDYVSRDWAAVRRAKDLYWRQRIVRLGPAEGVRVAEQLRQQAVARDPAWPSPADRHADLQAHVRLAGRLRRARPARRDHAAR